MLRNRYASAHLFEELSVELVHRVTSFKKVEILNPGKKEYTIRIIAIFFVIVIIKYFYFYLGDGILIIFT